MRGLSVGRFGVGCWVERVGCGSGAVGGRVRLCLGLARTVLGRGYRGPRPSYMGAWVREQEI